MRFLSSLVGAVIICGCGGEVAPSSDAGGMDSGSEAQADAGLVCARASECDDGLYCTGVETCVDAVCVPGESPCNASEMCNEDADDCVAMGCTDETADADQDGHRSTSCGGDDCDDGDPNRYPGNPEVCDTENQDEDCDPSTYGFRDQDMDGEPDATCCNGTECGSDCDDMRPGVNPRVPEVCGNGLDDDCDGAMDEGATVDGFADPDGDGYGDATMPMGACPGTPGFATMDGDCDEADEAINPGATEACDFVDNDCDSMVDEDLPTIRCYRDSDGDGYGAGGSVDACGCPEGYVTDNTDCLDGPPGSEDVHPGQYSYFSSPLWIHNLDGTVDIFWDYNCNGGVDEQPCGCGGFGTLCRDRRAPACPQSADYCGDSVPYVMCHADCSPPTSDGTGVSGCR